MFMAATALLCSRVCLRGYKAPRRGWNRPGGGISHSDAVTVGSFEGRSFAAIPGPDVPAAPVNQSPGPQTELSGVGHLTVKETALAVEPLRVALPAYLAMIEYVPLALTCLKDTEATPLLLRASLALLRVFAPFLSVKVTLPVAAVPNLDFTVAVALAMSFVAEYDALSVVFVVSLTTLVVTGVTPLSSGVVPALLMHLPKLPVVGNSTDPTLAPAAKPFRTTSP